MTPVTTRGPTGRATHLGGRATLFGAGAVVLWSTLALFTAMAEVPPFEKTALSFAVGGGLLALANLARGHGLSLYRQPWRVWAVGLGGMFAYHAFFFTALHLAPPAEASLVNYLWPLLIVVGTALLPGERLRPLHVLGAALGLGGVAFLLGPKAAFSFDAMGGYLAAAAGAVTWATYSLAARRFAHVPSGIVAGYALGTAVLAVPFHLMFETWVTPPDATSWLALLALGIGPVGLSFLFWDIGMKNGNPRLLGALAYGAPLASTVLLVLAGRAEPTMGIIVACIAITLGAFLAGRR